MDPGNAFTQTNFVSSGYKQSDVNMNCGAVYQGINNDNNPIFFNTLSHPGNELGTANYIIEEQLPE